MRIADKLRDLTTKARNSAGEHKDQVKQAVEKAETIADKRTGGKYHDRIAKTGAKVETYVEKLQPDASEQRQEGKPTPPATANDARQTPRDAVPPELPTAAWINKPETKEVAH